MLSLERIYFPESDFRCQNWRTSLSIIERAARPFKRQLILMSKDLYTRLIKDVLISLCKQWWLWEPCELFNLVLDGPDVCLHSHLKIALFSCRGCLLFQGKLGASCFIHAKYLHKFCRCSVFLVKLGFHKTLISNVAALQRIRSLLVLTRLVAPIVVPHRTLLCGCLILDTIHFCNTLRRRRRRNKFHSVRA